MFAQLGKEATKESEQIQQQILMRIVVTMDKIR